jgi:predicted Holliday junction resolvase-like endonuclease|tara:strand:- start:40 stop:306 length:267 start_codon:yes stop_codon:yes gene_type:complete
MIDFIKLIRENINTVLIAIMLIWIFSISIEIRQLKSSIEDWSQHIAEKVADAENKANLKYEADIETLETMFGLIYKLKQWEANDEDTE